MFHIEGWYPSYIEKSSKASPPLGGSGPAGPLILAQKRFNFSALRGSESASEPRAF
jgi:hypothetical protein